MKHVYKRYWRKLFYLEDNTIQPYTKIGDNCVLWSGNHIGHHSTIEDHSIITSHACISGLGNIKNIRQVLILLLEME